MECPTPVQCSRSMPRVTSPELKCQIASPYSYLHKISARGLMLKCNGECSQLICGTSRFRCNNINEYLGIVVKWDTTEALLLTRCTRMPSHVSA